MPQLDLESLFCVGGDDSRVSCETTLSDSGSGSDSDEGSANADDPYAPAESLRLRIGEDIGWAELRAVLERDDSTKGTSNPKSATRKSAAARSDSRRSSSSGVLKPPGKTVILGVLPAGKTTQHRRTTRRLAAAGARVFAAEAAEAEPASPKVSCFGDIRPVRPAPPPEEWSGCWASVTAALHNLCCSNWCSTTAAAEPSAVCVSPPRPAALRDAKLLPSRRWWPETPKREVPGSEEDGARFEV